MFKLICAIREIPTRVSDIVSVSGFEVSVSYRIGFQISESIGIGDVQTELLYTVYHEMVSTNLGSFCVVGPQTRSETGSKATNWRRVGTQPEPIPIIQSDGCGRGIVVRVHRIHQLPVCQHDLRGWPKWAVGLLDESSHRVSRIVSVGTVCPLHSRRRRCQRAWLQ